MFPYATSTVEARQQARKQYLDEGYQLASKTFSIYEHNDPNGTFDRFSGTARANYLGSSDGYSLQPSDLNFEVLYHSKCNLYPRGPDLDDVMKALSDIPQEGQNRQKADRLLSYYACAATLKQIHRFANKNQSRLQEYPSRDGKELYSYFGNPNLDALLQIEWELRRYFMKSLHLPGLIWRAEDGNSLHFGGMWSIKRIYAMGRVLHIMEIGRNWPDPDDNYELNNDDLHHKLLLFLEKSRKAILQVLEEVASMAFVPPTATSLSSRFFPNAQPAPATTMSREELLQANLSRDTFLDSMIQRFNELLAKIPFERFLMGLIEMENTLEVALSEEHVEDKLINKQVSTLDELDLPPIYDRKMWEEHSGPGEYFDDLREDIYTTLGDIGLINRQRRNFRLFRDWAGNRPWRQIWQFYDSSLPGFEWVDEPIKWFWEIEKAIDKDDIKYSSCYGVMANHLFTFCPHDAKYVKKQKQRGECSVCLKEYVPNAGFKSTILELHCGHNGHLHCILNLWDQPGKYLHKCPRCKAYPRQNYLEYGYLDRAPEEEVRPFVHNLDDYRVANLVAQTPKHIFVTEGNLYDVPSYDPNSVYWQRENELVNAIEGSLINWDRAGFPPGEKIQMSLSRPLNSRGKPIEFHDFHETAHNLRVTWTKRQIQRNPEGINMYEIGEQVNMPRAEFTPEQEAAYLRKRRREKDRERRNALRRDWRGLRSLIAEDRTAEDDEKIRRMAEERPPEKPRGNHQYDIKSGLWLN